MLLRAPQESSVGSRSWFCVTTLSQADQQSRRRAIDVPCLIKRLFAHMNKCVYLFLRRPKPESAKPEAGFRNGSTDMASRPGSGMATVLAHVIACSVQSFR
jgi:hypothetical protein